MAMTDKPRSPVLKLFIAKGRHERRKFGMDRLLYQLSDTITNDGRERV